MFCSRMPQSLLLLIMLLGMTATPLAAQESSDGAAPADQAAPPAATLSPEAVAAKQAFDAVYQQYLTALDQIKTVRQQRDAARGEEKLALNEQLQELRADAEKAIDKIIDAGVAVYAAAPDGYPEINSTLLAIAQFYLAGDPLTGDGGDQYEKALPPIVALLDAGAGEQWPQLWLWGAVAAYNTNDFARAEEYFAKADAAVLTGSGAVGTSQRLLVLAEQAQQNLPMLKRHWAQEEKIRAAEAAADDLPR
ncbi:MAG: hypothetical protein KDA44_08575, partial [Planctomycetales bacterium]|nr:hypothetical protein [Planctomycetales bacterium]